MTDLGALFAARAALVVPAAIGPAAAAEVRARLERRGYTRYALVDRGSYDVVAEPDEPALCAALAALAADRLRPTPTAAPPPLAVIDARAVRLGPGDFVLAHHDRVHDDHQLELVLDLSAAPVAGAEVHYRRGGQLYHRVAAAPGALSIVERDGGVTCHHTYVSRRQADAVVRLVLRLRA
ncbi:MAG: hypothetical protein IPH80_24000 [Myxococcales bacterium]|nr:hypothetical protein [Myxococcales bacterium]